jgi:lipopolysaccharide/colanic/teichoic acid biosynthesis glycosyltransferase
VLFSQIRLGRDGKPFRAFKFRSMRVGAETELALLKRHNEASGPLFKMRHDPRVTWIGRWLRRTSLDELPQVLNVLRGEMSLVGPPPPHPTAGGGYQEWHRKRLKVAPGMTGLWQVSGRSELPFDEMVLLDVYYIENWSLGLDFQILLRTLPAVVSGRGAY